MTQVGVVITRKCCIAELGIVMKPDIAQVNPVFFDKKECLGCSFYHVCNSLKKDRVGKKTRCKSCGHVFQADKNHMVYCPCGKTYSDWVHGDTYRYGGDFE